MKKPIRAHIDPKRLKNIEVIAEDDQILAIAKPPGLAVHGGANTKSRSLLQILESSWVNDVAPPEGLRLVHRIDRDTSGLVLLAKSADLQRQLQKQWPRVRKVYLAWVLGALKFEGVIDKALTDDGREYSARTRVRALKQITQKPASTLIYAELLTGRKHQIRRHLADKGYPILMDDKYGDFAQNRVFREQVKQKIGVTPKYLMLHSFYLEMPELSVERKKAAGQNSRERSTNEAPSYLAPPPELWGKIAGIWGLNVDLFYKIP